VDKDARSAERRRRDAVMLWREAPHNLWLMHLLHTTRRGAPEGGDPFWTLSLLTYPI